ncbi:MAG: response regulator [Flavobacterium sp.]|nr:response regulator [Flavobacterium sp.]
MTKEKKLYKIMVVEDNLGDFVLLEEYLHDSFLRLEIVNVTHFKELEQTQNDAINFDILFLDLNLPDKRGIDLVNACVALFKNIPIVVLTGYTDFELAKQSMSAGISDYLLKEDLNATTLYKCIIYNIERHRNVKEIKDSEQYYADLFHLSPNPLLVYDEKSMFILDVNDAAIATYHYKLEEFKNIKITDLQVENKLCEEIDENVILLNNDSKFAISNLECHLSKNGELLYIASKKNKIIYKSTNAVILSVENLTKEILYIQSINSQNKKLKQIAWMQSHIVRAPVARIMGLVNILSDETADKKDQNNVFKMIHQTATELDDVIKQIVQKSNQV